MDQNKKTRENQSGSEKGTSSADKPYVKKLIDCRDTTENRSFTGIDYNMMKDLFGNGDIAEAVQILRDSPPTGDDFDIDMVDHKNLISQPVINNSIFSEFLSNNIFVDNSIGEKITENEGDTSCPNSPSLMPETFDFRVDCQTPGLRFADDDLTDCDSPIKSPTPLNPTRLENSDVSATIQNSVICSDMSSNLGSDFDDSDADPNYNNQEDFQCSNNSDTEKSLSNLSDTDNRENARPKTRKRKGNPAQWARNRAKLFRNSGQEYRTVKNGKLMPSRKMGPPCTASCRRKCSINFNEDERMNHFQLYWSLKDLNRQRQFIANSMELIQPKYRYPILRENQKARNLNHTFSFYKEHEKIKVCKMFFTSTLGITNRCIRTVINKTDKGFTSEDRRGKHEKRAMIPKEIKDGARNHISSIPTVESHYTRADSSKNYIEGGRTLTDLYRDYKKGCEEQSRDFVTFSIYRQIFNYEFNMEFFKPKKDLCQFCESYKNKNHSERLEAEIEYMRHHEEKNLARAEKEVDKALISKYYRVACFDLQAALPTPKGEVSTFYYKSKLSTYNFTICDLNKKGLGTVNCYLWHEGEGHKGSNEIGSCLLSYLEACSTIQDVVTKDLHEVEVVFYSDNCGGQGKNKFIISAYLYAALKFNIKSITHKFLIVGHTQNEGDVSHSLIEKNIKKALKCNPIYLPSQYATLISTARKSGESFKVHELDHDFFLDLKELADITTTNFNVNADGNKFNFNDICVLRVEKDNPGMFFYKTSYKDDVFKSVNVTACRTRKKLQHLNDVQLKKAYQGKIPISKRKFDDLLSLVNANTIPRCYADFFTNLKHE